MQRSDLPILAQDVVFKIGLQGSLAGGISHPVDNIFTGGGRHMITLKGYLGKFFKIIVTKNVQQGRIGKKDPIPLRDANSHQGLFDQPTISLFALPQHLLPPLAFGDVSGNSQHHRLTFDPNRIGANIHNNLTSIFPVQGEFIRAGGFPQRIFCQQRSGSRNLPGG